jgi:hypothetical protein
VDNGGAVQRFFMDKIPDLASVSVSPMDTGVLENIIRIDFPAKVKNEDGVVEEKTLLSFPIMRGIIGGMGV